MCWAIRDGEVRVLLTERSRHVDQPGTWSIPGGAIAAGETPLEAATRETGEELAGVRVITTGEPHTAACEHACGWAYTTYPARVRSGASLPRITIQPAAAWETTDARWLTPAEVATLPLHPGFAESWPALRPSSPAEDSAEPGPARRDAAERHDATTEGT